MEIKEKISEAKLTLYMLIAAVAYVIVDVLAIVQSGFNVM